MSHTIRDKNQLLARVRRIQGQLRAVERSLVDKTDDCFGVLQTATAARGALNGLVAAIIEGHIELHVLDEHKRPTPAQKRAAREINSIIRAFLR